MKTPMTSHDLLTLFGLGEPKLSSRVKIAIEAELAKPQYKSFPGKKAWVLACRWLAVHEPGAFDPENADDLSLQKLFPLIFTEAGERLPIEEVFSKLELCDFAITHEVRGRDVILALTAREKNGPPQTVRFKLPLKPGAKLPEFGVHLPKMPS